jgi:hypothetical protein
MFGTKTLVGGCTPNRVRRRHGAPHRRGSVGVERRIKSTQDVAPLMTAPRPSCHCEEQLAAGWDFDEVESRAPDLRRQFMPSTPWRGYRANRRSNNITHTFLCPPFQPWPRLHPASKLPQTPTPTAFSSFFLPLQPCAGCECYEALQERPQIPAELSSVGTRL